MRISGDAAETAEKATRYIAKLAKHNGCTTIADKAFGFILTPKAIDGYTNALKKNSCLYVLLWNLSTVKIWMVYSAAGMACSSCVSRSKMTVSFLTTPRFWLTVLSRAILPIY